MKRSTCRALPVVTASIGLLSWVRADKPSGDKASLSKCVCVGEAHPSDQQKPTETNAKDNILVKQSTTLTERCTVAGQCSTTLKIKGTLVVESRGQN